MTREERIAAKKISRIMRASRKSKGLTQINVSEKLGISQGALSKLEHGSLIPSAPQWFEFCQLVGISTDSLLTGYIERLRPAVVTEGIKEGGFKLPKRYATHRGSKVRALQPFLHFFQECAGEEKFHQFLEAQGVDPDFLIDFDNQISLEFTLDLTRYLVNEKYLKPKDLVKLVKPVTQPSLHGGLHKKYDEARTQQDLFQALVMNARLYECNFTYLIEDRKRTHLELSVKPENHLHELGYRNDTVLGDFLCQFKRSYFERFLSYGLKETESRPARVDEVECHFHGAQRCVYRVALAG